MMLSAPSRLFSASRHGGRIRNRLLLLSSEYDRRNGIHCISGSSLLRGVTDRLSIDNNCTYNRQNPLISGRRQRWSLSDNRQSLAGLDHRHCSLFHSTPVASAEDEEEKPMSDKEKKKMLKQKAKAAIAAAAAEKEGNDEEKPVKTEVNTDDGSGHADNEPAADAASDASSSEEKHESSTPPEDTKTAVTAEEPAKPEEVPTSTSDSTASSSEPKQYSYPELTADAARHKAGLDDPDRPRWQNPLHHDNPDMQKVFREDYESEEEFQAAIVPAPPLSFGDDDEIIAAPAHLNEIAEEILHLTMLEMNELTNKLADHYGFHEGMLSPDDVLEAMDDAGTTNEQADAVAAVEKTAFDIKLVSFDAKSKIKVIKEVRAIAGLGLKEAKEMVEGAPIIVIKEMKKEQAEEMKTKLEELGATIEII